MLLVAAPVVLLPSHCSSAKTRGLPSQEAASRVASSFGRKIARSALARLHQRYSEGHFQKNGTGGNPSPVPEASTPFLWHYPN
jgi:hypothetical protein